MNAKDFIAVLEYQKAFKKPAKRKKDIDLTKLNLAEVFLKLKEQQEKIRIDLEQIEKLMKKEDKKDDKKGKPFNPLHVAMWLLATTPITGPLLLLYWAKIFASIQGVH